MPTVFFFCDDEGRVVEARAGEYEEWNLSPGTVLGNALNLDCPGGEPLPQRFPLKPTMR